MTRDIAIESTVWDDLVWRKNDTLRVISEVQSFFFYRFPHNREHKGKMEIDENNGLCSGLSLANQDIVGASARSSNKR